MSWSLEIHHIDVTGSGDATLIVAREGILNRVRSVLIDGGRYQYGDDVHQYLCKVLAKNPDMKTYHALHAIVVTHYDSDHVGGIVRLLKMPGTDLYTHAQIYDQGGMNGGKGVAADEKTAYDDYCRALGDRKRFSASEVELVGRDILWMDEIRPPDAPQIVCVAANCQVITGYKGEKPIVEMVTNSMLRTSSNERSLALLVRWQGFSYYVAGDIEKVQEDKLCTGLNVSNTARERVLVLKTSHHGANTATSRAFANRLRPTAAFISCGTSNMYQHPAQETVNVLDGYEAILYPTHKDGKHPAPPPDPPYRPIPHYMTGFQSPSDADDPEHGHLGGTEAIVAGDPRKQPGNVVLKVTEQQARMTPVTGRIFASVKSAVTHTSRAGGVHHEVASRAGEIAGEVALVSNAASIAATTLFALNFPDANIAPAALTGAITGANVLINCVIDITTAVQSVADVALMRYIQHTTEETLTPEKYVDMISANIKEEFIRQFNACLDMTDAKKLVKKDECQTTIEAFFHSEKVADLIKPALLRGPYVMSTSRRVVKRGREALKVEFPSYEDFTQLEGKNFSDEDIKALTQLGEVAKNIEELSVDLNKGMKKIEAGQKSKNISNLGSAVTSAMSLISNSVEELKRTRESEEEMKQKVAEIQSASLKKKIEPLLAKYCANIEEFQAALEVVSIEAQALQSEVDTFLTAAWEMLGQVAVFVNGVLSAYLLPVAVKAGQDNYAHGPSSSDQPLLMATATATALASAADVAMAGGAEKNLLLAIAEETIEALSQEDQPVSMNSFRELLQYVVRMVINIVSPPVSPSAEIAQERPRSITWFIDNTILPAECPKIARIHSAAAAAAAACVIFRATYTDVEHAVNTAIQATGMEENYIERIIKARDTGDAAKKEVENEHHDGSFTVEFYDVTAHPALCNAIINHW